MGEPERIELSLSTRGKLIYIGAAVAFVIVGFWSANNATQEGRDIPLTTSVSIIAAIVCGFLLWRTGRRGVGEIRLDDEGIVLDTGTAVGRVTWDNFERAGIFRKWGRQMLGIAVADPQRFLDSRAGMQSKHKLDVNVLSVGNRVAMIAPPQGMDMVGKVLGWKAMPKSGSEIEMLAWARANMGYDICIGLIGVTNGADIPARIDARRPAGVVPLRPPSGVAQPAAAAASPATAAPPPMGPAEGYKTCPMCAEPIRAAAKVCRFCGYKFEGAAAPG
jgi:hypothetical protein